MGLFGAREVKKLKKQGDVEGLVRILWDKARGGTDRRYAAHALGELGDPTAVDALLSVLEDLQVRGFAAEALGKIGDLRAAGPVAQLLKADNSIVRARADLALGNLIAHWGPENVNLAVRGYLLRDYPEPTKETETLIAMGPVPIEEWEDCPLCGGDLDPRFEHAAYCPQCERHFCDGDYAPVVSQKRGSEGLLIGTRNISFWPSDTLESHGHPPIGRFLTVTVWQPVKEDDGAHKGHPVALDGALMRALSYAVPD